MLREPVPHFDHTTSTLAHAAPVPPATALNQGENTAPAEHNNQLPEDIGPLSSAQKNLLIRLTDTDAIHQIETLPMRERQTLAQRLGAAHAKLTIHKMSEARKAELSEHLVAFMGGVSYAEIARQRGDKQSTGVVMALTRMAERIDENYSPDDIKSLIPAALQQTAEVPTEITETDAVQVERPLIDELAPDLDDGELADIEDVLDLGIHDLEESVTVDIQPKRPQSKKPNTQHAGNKRMNLRAEVDGRAYGRSFGGDRGAKSFKSLDPALKVLFAIGHSGSFLATEDQQHTYVLTMLNKGMVGQEIFTLPEAKLLIEEAIDKGDLRSDGTMLAVTGDDALDLMFPDTTKYRKKRQEKAIAALESKK